MRHKKKKEKKSEAPRRRPGSRLRRRARRGNQNAHKSTRSWCEGGEIWNKKDRIESFQRSGNLRVLCVCFESRSIWPDSDLVKKKEREGEREGERKSDQARGRNVSIWDPVVYFQRIFAIPILRVLLRKNLMGNRLVYSWVPRQPNGEENSFHHFASRIFPRLTLCRRSGFLISFFLLFFGFIILS